ncbi:MAG: hypothetical protein HKN26_02720, partial [Acidimicrobiales bacterium]|nr:hypothetical protein [Acidimicrobiales bacterium]
MTPLEIVQITSPQINVSGAAFYFHPDTLARGQELGLRGFPFYFLGRGGLLGEVDAAAVTEAFGYFHASIIEAMWGREFGLTHTEVAREYLACGA